MSKKPSKIEVEEKSAPVEMEREAMQPVVRAALDKVVGEMNMVPNIAHARRMMRVLMREAAKIGLSGGCPPQAFAGLAYECLVKEAQGMDDGQMVSPLLKFTDPDAAQA